jgi:hypothetical protein
MLLHQSDYDSDAVALMGRVCDEAWMTLKSEEPHYPVPEIDARATMAMRVMRAVAKGERDTKVLKAIALALAVSR